MKALDLLLNRYSCARLAAPAPEGAELEVIWKAGLRAPDHGGLTPWRFIHVSGEGLSSLSSIFAKAAEAEEGDHEKAKAMPFRAPLITIVIASPKVHSKVPEIEQVLSAGCAVHAMQMAAFAQGYNGIWRTGPMAYSPVVNQQLGLSETESIVGYLYLGSAQTKANKPRELDFKDYVSWL
ncbi:NAD(P)H nitroreductase [Agarivorans sp. TSD2052]|uniref:NAD(P)H nitroreductase n=1 Tax=Agarivorans sp. TSD2052 TaxID=2937286 RepID=UPI00200E9BA3|nr:NAD(P)H nitroreductase [Agarivorans sp. TSD2052]UPW20438.1 NAD(P)H nitroreductase [Agarivorans sp. TSD2052]